MEIKIASLQGAVLIWAELSSFAVEPKWDHVYLYIEWHWSEAYDVVVIIIFCDISPPYSPSAFTVGRWPLASPSPSLV